MSTCQPGNLTLWAREWVKGNGWGGAGNGLRGMGGEGQGRG